MIHFVDLYLDMLHAVSGPSCKSWLLLAFFSASLCFAAQTIAIDVVIAGGQVVGHTSSAFVGVNIDSASLYQGHRLDFTDPVFVALTKRLNTLSASPMTLRIGSSAADTTGYGPGTTNQTISLDFEYWDQLINFARETQSLMVFDLNALNVRASGSHPSIQQSIHQVALGTLPMQRCS